MRYGPIRKDGTTMFTGLIIYKGRKWKITRAASPEDVKRAIEKIVYLTDAILEKPHKEERDFTGFSIQFAGYKGGK